MKLFFFIFWFLFFFQINYSVAQIDPKKQENKGTGTEEKKRSSKDKKKSTDIDEMSSEEDTNGVGDIDSDNNINIKASSISYSNVFEIINDGESLDDGNTPVNRQKVKLMIHNNHSVPMWYLMPASGEKNMPDDGKFMADQSFDTHFLAKKYSLNNKHLIELTYIGSKGHCFKAFYIDSGASLLFRNYDLGTYRTGENVPFWSAEKLYLNDKYLLSEWLPYTVMSTPNVVIKNVNSNIKVSSKNLEYDKDLSNVKVLYIQAKDIIKYQIPVGSTR
ncbi:MAG: hypothetical protein MK207_11755 [Saprospiraceae bacterium]|nr:hypothetical protein [Saprospiraceae bacterium]